MTGTTSSPLPSLRSAYRAIPLYGGADPAPVDIDLSDNTNQWGVPPSAGRALAQLPVDSAARYPQAYSPALARAIDIATSSGDSPCARMRSGSR